jgi:hypothetical protein
MAVMTFPTNMNTGYEISRLLTAAVINQKFRNMLLAQPEQALANGYNGEPFQLASEEKIHISSIHANSLAEFATQLTDHRATHSYQSNLRGRLETHVFPAIGLD